MNITKLPPKERILQYKKMLQFHQDNENARNRTLKNKLQKEIDFLELQEFAEKREKRVVTKANIKIMMKYSHAKKEASEPTHEVITVETEVEPEQLFEGTKRECEVYVKSSGLITLEIKPINQ